MISQFSNLHRVFITDPIEPPFSRCYQQQIIIHPIIYIIIIIIIVIVIIINIMCVFV